MSTLATRTQKEPEKMVNKSIAAQKKGKVKVGKLDKDLASEEKKQVKGGVARSLHQCLVTQSCYCKTP
jgi:hypothetical protein